MAIGTIRDETHRSKPASGQPGEMSVDALERRVAERTAELDLRMRQLRAIAAQIHRVEQRERARLASILHDDLQQLLVAALTRTQLIPEAANPSTPAGQVRQLIREAIESSRSLTADIRPPFLCTESPMDGLHALARHMAERHGLAVHVDVPDDQVLDGLNEERRIVLLQSVRELLFNVFKHSGVLTARVGVTTQPGRVEVVVEDHGKGFPVAASAMEETTGTGLGLVSMRERLDFIGCGLVVESQPGSYTRVTLQIPLEAMATPQLPERLHQATGSLPGAPARSRSDRQFSRHLRVLLADNHRVLRESLGELLRAQGDMDVVGEAGNGREAVHLALSLKPDVVVMDVGMPGLDGIDATRAILEQSPGTRIVSLSRHEESDTTAAMLEAGAETYLTKGGPTSDLIAAIRGER